MKNFTFILAICSTIQLIGQSKIDRYLTISFPEEPSKENFSESGYATEGFYFNSSSESFVLMKQDAFSSDLNELYDFQTETLKKSLKKKNLDVTSEKDIYIDEYSAKLLKSDNQTTKENLAEVLIINLDKSVYTIMYSAIDTFNVKSKRDFFDSIKITNQPTQMKIKKSITYTVLKGILVIVGLIVSITLYKKSR